VISVLGISVLDSTHRAVICSCMLHSHKQDLARSQESGKEVIRIRGYWPLSI
jgi:hypothetical protein